MVYANTSAAVKARADWVVTSSIAVELIEHLDSLGKNYLGAGQTPGNYVQNRPGPMYCAGKERVSCMTSLKLRR